VSKETSYIQKRPNFTGIPEPCRKESASDTCPPAGCRRGEAQDLFIFFVIKKTHNIIEYNINIWILARLRDAEERKPRTF
jgi:hypothetical protein